MRVNPRNLARDRDSPVGKIEVVVLGKLGRLGRETRKKIPLCVIHIGSPHSGAGNPDLLPRLLVAVRHFPALLVWRSSLVAKSKGCMQMATRKCRNQKAPLSAQCSMLNAAATRQNGHGHVDPSKD